MSKVLRLFRNGNNNITDWQAQSSYVYDATNRSQIPDTTEASKYIDITSIPSPFARMELVKDAFAHIVKTGSIDADDIYGRTVSDTLDVGELFFNIDKFSDKLEIISCDIREVAKSLVEDKNDIRHRSIGDTLIKYLESDAKSFNFDKMNKIYMLRYATGDSGMQVLGATSPRTLFFSTANNLSKLSDVFSFGQDKPFDMDLQPLYKRDFEYVKSWFYMRNTISNFALLFPEVNEYLKLVRDKFPEDKRRILDNATSGDGLETIDVGDAGTDHVEVLGNSVFKKKVTACTDSDFEIVSSLLDERQKPFPLVLPVKEGYDYSELKYTEDLWGNKNHAPYYDDNDLDKRRLPRPGNIRQPYLVISDFLEDYLVSVPHSLNTESFFDGNINFRYDEQQVSYLLPLKKRFFNYFTVEELIGKKMIEMETTPGRGVTVKLHIPIKGKGNIKTMNYSRTYYDNDKHDAMPNRDSNVGAIRIFGFTGLVMPNYRFLEDNDAYYTLSCVSMKSDNYVYHIFKGSSELKDGVFTAVRNPCGPNDEPFKAVNYSIEKHLFDFIQVSDKERVVQGVIVPKFINQPGNSEMHFSVDLGTSNTLVEYAVPNSTTGRMTPTIFQFGVKDEQVCLMHKPTIMTKDNGEIVQFDLQRESQLISKDFLPKALGQDSDFSFPNRTVLSAKINLDWLGDRIDPFSLVNIPFTYGKRQDLTYNRNYFDIKWGQSEEGNKILRKYVECLMIMIRNKVVLNNGDLRKTQVTWFYPISMDQARQGMLEQIWNESYQKYFNQSGVTSAVTESSAPVKAFYETNPNASRIVSVDIGGGTTDLAFSQKRGEVSYVTSFRFATNDLFETPYSKINAHCGIIDQFCEKFRSILVKKPKMKELLNVFDSADNQDPVNMASFLFSLKDNSLIRSNDIDERSVDFGYNLQIDPHFKIVFLLYYSAIIYHLAKIIKVANEDKVSEEIFVPRQITFSGNGSKIITTITPDIKGVLTSYTRMIVEKVAGIKCDNFELLGFDSSTAPKEATCKGGLLTDGAIDDRDKRVALEATGRHFIGKGRTYGQVTKEDENSIVTEVSHFFNFILEDMNHEFNFMKKFQMTQTSLDIATSVCKNDLQIFLEKALDEHRDNADTQIEETAFFYPIKGVLNALSTRIYDALHKSDE